MNTRANSSAARGPILLLADDRPSPRLRAVEDFDAAPFQSQRLSPLLPDRSRLVDDADGWAMWRTERLSLEHQMAAQEAGRLLNPETAEHVRDRLAEIERRVCDVRPEEFLSELSVLQQTVQTWAGKSDA